MLSSLIGRFIASSRPEVEPIIEEASAARTYRDAEAAVAAGQVERAVAIYRHGLKENPWAGWQHVNLGVLLLQLDRLDEAEASFGAALAYQEARLAATTNLGFLALRRSDLATARQRFNEALAIAPNDAKARSGLGNVCYLLGDASASAHHQEIAWQHAADDNAIASAWLLSICYDQALSPENLRTAHRQWGEVASRATRGTVPTVIRERSNGRLRVGYLSPNFNEHPVSYFFQPLLAFHDRHSFHVTCFHDSRCSDHHTSRLRSYGDVWVDTYGLSDDDLMRRVAESGIDILVDLAGHSADNRLPIFARRAAPVQITMIGYPATTGLSAMDWKVTDVVADPEGAEVYYTEQLIRLPRTFWCFRSPCSLSQLKSSRGRLDPVVFGCLGNLAKITDDALVCWAEILRQLPQARLVIRAVNLSSSLVRDSLVARIAACGLPLRRVELLPPTAAVAFSRAYEGVDIVLDTFPFNGGTTTCHALLAGVPVVSRFGAIQLSRMGLSMLNNVGLADFAAANWDDYVRIAVSLAENRPLLAHLHATLPHTMLASAVMDGASYTKHLEAAYLMVVDRDMGC